MTDKDRRYRNRKLPACRRWRSATRG